MPESICNEPQCEERLTATRRPKKWCPEHRRNRRLTKQHYACLACSADISDKRADAKWCSLNCQANHKRWEKARQANPEWLPIKERADLTCAEAECARQPHARRLCKMHYRRWERANGMARPPSSAWGDSARNRYHQRRAERPRRGDPVILSALIERDGLTCSWCERPIDLTLTWPHKMYRTIDHVVPVSKGGEHSLENTRLLHHSCNSSRGNRAA